MIKRLFSTTINNCPITITNNAWEKMHYIINQGEYTSFLFSASSGGCNGFNYKLELLNKEEFNEIYNTKIKPIIIENNNTKLLIDPIAEMLLIGTKIDYVSEDYNKGIFENKFIFIPDKNLASSCGCGVSFTPKKK